MDDHMTDLTINLQQIKILAPWLNQGIQVILVIQVTNHKINRPKHNLAIGELREILKEDVRLQILMVKKDMRLENIYV